MSEGFPNELPSLFTPTEEQPQRPIIEHFVRIFKECPETKRRIPVFIPVKDVNGEPFVVDHKEKRYVIHRASEGIAEFHEDLMDLMISGSPMP